MKVHDVLLEIDRRQLTEEGADSILDRILDSAQAEKVESLLALSRAEWTAHCHGATFSDLARWRYHGWPTQCAACGREINVADFGWKVVEVGGFSNLKHIRCPVPLEEHSATSSPS